MFTEKLPLLNLAKNLFADHPQLDHFPLHSNRYVCA